MFPDPVSDTAGSMALADPPITPALRPSAVGDTSGELALADRPIIAGPGDDCPRLHVPVGDARDREQGSYDRSLLMRQICCRSASG